MSYAIPSDSTAKEVRAVIARDTPPYSLDLRAENIEDPRAAIRDLSRESLRKRQELDLKVDLLKSAADSLFGSDSGT